MLDGCFMVGFQIVANGSYDFQWSRGAWTEGDLWFLKAVMKTIPKDPWLKGNKSTIDVIEKGFANIKDALVNQIGNIGLNMHLTVTNDFNFMYKFEAMKNGRQTTYELLQILADQKNDMNDQVMIYFCQCLKDFQFHVFTKKSNNLQLRVDIDL